jgi:hypothetical protein
MPKRDRRAARTGWRIASLSALVSTFLIGGLLALNHPKHAGDHPNPPSSVKDHDAALKRYAAMPLYFERNVGQSDPRVRYLSHTSRSSLFLTDDTAVITMVGGALHHSPRTVIHSPVAANDAANDKMIESAVRIRLVGANAHPQFEGLEPLRGRVNYLIGKDPAKYHRDVPVFARVKMKGIYPGVDLVYYGTPEALEYDLVAAPGADTSKLKFAIEGKAKTSVASNGNLVVVTAAGVIVLQKPRIYQQDAAGKMTPVDGAFAMAGDGTIDAGIPRREVAFNLARYDHHQTLTIDPIISFGPAPVTQQLRYSTYLGGSGSSSGFIPLESLSGISFGFDLYFADAATDVALDPNNMAYVTGVAFSNDFPTFDAPQDTLEGANSPPNQNPNAFVSKFDYSQQGAASLIYSTYFGGSGDTTSEDAGEGNGDLAFGIAADAAGDAFIVGQTYSSDLPIECGDFGQTNDQANSFTNVGFVTKFNSDGSDFDYSCYIDGANNATEARVALYPPGCGSSTACKAYVVGSTQSDATTGFPVTDNAFQTTLSATNGESAATLLVVHEDGQSLDYATLFGGSGNGVNAEAGLAVAVDTGTDSVGNAYITGATFSSDLPMVGPQVAAYGGSTNGTSNAFVAEFAPSAVVDNDVMSGKARSGAIGKPAVPGDPASLVYSTYLGGSGAVADNIFFPLAVGDAGTGIAYDGDDETIWVTGFTASTDFQVPGQAASVFQTSNLAAATAGPPATALFLTELNPAVLGSSGVLYSTYISGGGVAADTGLGTIGFGDAATAILYANHSLYLTGFATSGGTASEPDSSGSSRAGLASGSFPLSANACFTANNSSGLSFGEELTIPITSFVLRLDPLNGTGATQLGFSTLLGGSGKADVSNGIQLDSNGLIVVAGLTFSTDFPVTSSAFQSTNATTGHDPVESQAFLSVLDPNGTLCGATATPSSTPTSTPAVSPTATPPPSSIATPTPPPSTIATPTPPPSTIATPTPPPSSIATPTPPPSSIPTPTATPAGSVNVIEPASGGGQPGATVGLGSFSYSPANTNQQIVTSVSVSVSRPQIFSSLTLSVLLNSEPVGTVTVDAPNITSTTVFVFSPAITIPSGGEESMTFSLGGVISGGKAALLEGMPKVELAGISAGPLSHGSSALMLSFMLFGFVMLPLGDRKRRQASMLAGALLLIATTLAGCGGGGGSGGTSGSSSSTQKVVAIAVSEGGNPVGVANLPIDLGTIRKQ